jgi:hypothetical protein
MKREFLLHKEKEENGKPSPQKQEFSCSSPSAVTSQPHTCFFTPTFELKITSIKSHFKPYFSASLNFLRNIRITYSMFGLSNN